MPETASISRPWSDTSWLKQLERSCRRWQLTWLQLVLRGELHLGMHLGFCDPRRSHVTPKQAIVWGTGPVYSSRSRGEVRVRSGLRLWVSEVGQADSLGSGPQRRGGAAHFVRQKKAPMKGLFQTLLLFFIVRVFEGQRLMDLPRRFLLTLTGTTRSLGSRLLGRSTVAMAARRMTASISISMMSRSS